MKHVLPMHYGTFPILAGTPDELRAALQRRGLADVEVHAVAPGGTIEPEAAGPGRRRAPRAGSWAAAVRGRG